MGAAYCISKLMEYNSFNNVVIKYPERVSDFYTSQGKLFNFRERLIKYARDNKNENKVDILLNEMINTKTKCFNPILFKNNSLKYDNKRTMKVSLSRDGKEIRLKEKVTPKI